MDLACWNECSLPLKICKKYIWNNILKLCPFCFITHIGWVVRWDSSPHSQTWSSAGTAAGTSFGFWWAWCLALPGGSSLPPQTCHKSKSTLNSTTNDPRSPCHRAQAGCVGFGPALFCLLFWFLLSLGLMVGWTGEDPPVGGILGSCSSAAISSTPGNM